MKVKNGGSLLFVGCYLLWVVTALLGVLDVFSARNLLLKIMFFFSVSRWVYPAIDKFFLMAVVMGWLVLVLFCENYYREGVIKGKFWKRFSLITALQILFFFASQITSFFMLKSKTLSWFTILTLGTEIFIGSLLLLYGLSLSHAKK